MLFKDKCKSYSIILFVFSFIIIGITLLMDTHNDLISTFDDKNYNIYRDNKIISNISKLNNKKNSDVVGTLEVLSSGKKDKIMQTTNNEFYLNHSSDKSFDYRGSIFLDYRLDINNSKKLIIYGHSSKDVEMPFNFLQNFYNKTYYEKHKYIEVKTDKIKKRYEVFSVFVETEDFSYMDINFVDGEDFLLHNEKLKSKSIYETNVKLSKDDEILILQTCSLHNDYKNYENKYLLIISRRV